jgi:hypothetical protein
MGQQQVVDGDRVEPERLGVILVQVLAALEHAAVDKDSLTGAFDEVAGTGNLPVCTVERDFHERESFCEAACILAAPVILATACGNFHQFRNHSHEDSFATRRDHR